MAKEKVTAFRAEWNPVASRGAIRIQTEESEPRRVPVDSSHEFVAVLLLLSKGPVYYDPDTGDLEIGPRPV